MKTEKPKFPREQALAVAQTIYDRLVPFCERIKVAGSLRRYRRTVGDIEILYVPKMAPDPASMMGALFGVAQAELIDIAETTINRMVKDGFLAKRPNVNGSEIWGSQNKLAVHVSTGIPVDFFKTSTQNWWVALVIRTGGKLTNLKLTKAANERGLTLNAYGSGFTKLSTGEKIPCNSERDVFKYAGVPYRDPQYRE